MTEILNIAAIIVFSIIALAYLPGGDIFKKEPGNDRIGDRYNRFRHD